MNIEAIPEAIKELSENKAVVLDVRRDDEWAEGHAAGATHFDVAKLEAGEMPEVAKDMPVYTYCKAGGRAQRAAEILTANGWTKVTNIGGYSDWEAAGGPVEK